MKRVLIILAMVLFLIPSLGWGQSAKDAYRALMKVEGAVETGVTKSNYFRLLADAKTELNMLRNSGKDPEAYRFLEKAYSHYRVAGEFWNLFSSRGFPLSSKGDDYGLDYWEIGRNVIKNYPKINLPMNKGGCVFEKKKDDVDQRDWVYLPCVYYVIWIEAGKALKEAGKLIK
jgi:hypothetical protein